MEFSKQAPSVWIQTRRGVTSSRGLSRGQKACPEPEEIPWIKCASQLRGKSCEEAYREGCHRRESREAIHRQDRQNLDQGSLWQWSSSDKEPSVRKGPKGVRREPNQNGFVESFHGRFRDECLNHERFSTLTEARVVIENYRAQYNTFRPHKQTGLPKPGHFRGQEGSHHLSLRSACGLLASEMDNPTPSNYYTNTERLTFRWFTFLEYCHYDQIKPLL